MRFIKSANIVLAATTFGMLVLIAYQVRKLEEIDRNVQLGYKRMAAAGAMLELDFIELEGAARQLGWNQGE